MTSSDVSEKNSLTSVAFTVAGWEFIKNKNTIKYRFYSDTIGEFSESVVYPNNIELSKHVNSDEFIDLLNLSAFFIGISYYKGSLEKLIRSSLEISPNGQQCVREIYTSGLGELYARNELVFPPDIKFDIPRKAEYQAGANESNGRAVDDSTPIVAFGGGKDSHAAIELLKRYGKKPCLVSVVLSEAAENKLSSMCAADISFIHRRIDPRLIELNNAGKAVNGHIPITAINSVLLAIYAYCSDKRWVVFSNERGASVCTTRYMGHEINHQYSKSLEFESLFRNCLYDVLADRLQYFSILRPFSELWIAAFVAKESRGIHKKFSSCNRNFIFSKKFSNMKQKRWCGECSKCIYTAIIFAPNLSESEFLNIFEFDILGSEKNLTTALELCGLDGDKPWDCVGDIEDTASAMHYLANDPEWKNKIIPRIIGPRLDAQQEYKASEEKYIAELASRSTNFLPDSIFDIGQPPEQEVNKQEFML